VRGRSGIESARLAQRLGRLFAVYRSTADRLREAEEDMRGQPMTYMTANGQQRLHPLVKISSQAQAHMLRIAAQFGLSPITRLRLSGFNPPKPLGKFDRLIG
jgi:P27 family predicted phage terminase small subunit